MVDVYPITSFAQPYEVFKCIKNSDKIAALLESVTGPQNKAKYSIIAWGKRDYIYADNSEDIAEKLYNPIKDTYNGDISNFNAYIGYISYDAVRNWESIKDLRKPAEDWPNGEFFLPENLIVYDHNGGKVYVKGDLPTSLGCGEIGEVKFSIYDESMKKNEYENGVKEILEQIKSGYAFQVVLSRFYRYSYSGDLMRLYYNLRKINPSPYMFYVKFYDRELIGSSPELLFSLQNGIIESFPIAGTRPRGKSEEEDFELEQELINSEKERAEHLMLVDLARNDIGKVSQPGTVKVPDFMYIEKYAYVQHIVSRVIGTLRKGYSPTDIIKATFPAGTVSGAPKPMAMNIIESLEPYKRGPYAGVVGFISNNSAEFAISLRSAFVNKDLIRIQAGAGIVYDSIPEMEFYETEHKLKGLKTSMGVN
ncbi:anthranilate synthase component I [Acidianus sulfidivorans JP7]|uniref:anthranilate synthase n=1 Tax=Acidianus sulfidivorans JP7 TaxID=619593 RepID=A0A2U9IP21_9CREN|nr:anthranilate synthase component I [Acidianus sulfidivorans]AWR97762.1 anthranilate synthase component I [Acidianus sulfidivorans JP7]